MKIIGKVMTVLAAIATVIAVYATTKDSTKTLMTVMIAFPLAMAVEIVIDNIKE